MSKKSSTFAVDIIARLFTDYIVEARTRYENHRLFYTPEDDGVIEFGGILAASILAAFIVDTDEGDARGIALDTDSDRAEFFSCYEREIRRNDWGYLSAEVRQLHDNYILLVVGSVTLRDLCPNIRLLNLAMDLTVTYMHHLVLEIFHEHIWDVISNSQSNILPISVTLQPPSMPCANSAISAANV